MNFRQALLTLAKSRVIELEEIIEKLRDSLHTRSISIGAKEIGIRIESAESQKEFNQYIVDEYANMGIK